ncbi:hypothetical protein ATSB10_31970 [Dyella thiooxydans]|uniref:DUF6671 domain-containing protein n=1 Tax=Dyella thiooxydans TaxID=445710 RepID=A0A160N3S0_9GAMM|nr:DUF6671 family protein [Dyella thiooxydans]AND70651.1 hypothetical protein ATSB10_31970 [Dyella thiooxydans]
MAEAVPSLCGETAVLATMHGKERAIAPLLARFLGVRVVVPEDFDTDRFGTFSRDVARTSTSLETARAKIRTGFERVPEARLGLASEGSFGPHPHVPFLAWGSEQVVLVDRATGLELVGRHEAPARHFAHARVEDVDAARAFAARVGFPRQGVIVMGMEGGQPTPAVALAKDAHDDGTLVAAVRRALDACEAASVETDMRAHRNPQRMRCIRRATVDLLRAWRSRCPACARPGFVISARLPGRPCGWCGAPTRQVLADERRCAGCGHLERRPRDGGPADPAHCDACNP